MLAYGSKAASTRGVDDVQEPLQKVEDTQGDMSAQYFAGYSHGGQQ